MRTGLLARGTCGAPQGAVISPILANSRRRRFALNGPCRSAGTNPRCRTRTFSGRDLRCFDARGQVDLP
jgi:hypothetical protein